MKSLKQNGFFIFFVLIIIILPVIIFTIFSIKESTIYMKHYIKTSIDYATSVDSVKTTGNNISTKDSFGLNQKIVKIDKIDKIKEYSFRLILIFSIILVIIGIVIIWVETGGLSSFRLLRISFKLWLIKILNPLIFGAIGGILFVLLYLHITKQTWNYNISSEYSSIIGIYIGSIALSITAYGLFVHKTIILDINTFMEHLVIDLNKVSSRFVWCYPGLSFGSVSAKGGSNGKLYKLYRQQMLMLFLKKTIEKSFYIFRENDIIDLYEPYINYTKIFEEEKVKERKLEDINKAKEDSKMFIKIIEQSIKIQENESDNFDGDLRKILVDVKEKDKTLRKDVIDYIDNFSLSYTPPNFRFFVIIIDNVVNILTPFGLPQRFDHKFEFTHDPKIEHPVNFLVVRFVDRTSANSLKKQIDNELEIIKRYVKY